MRPPRATFETSSPCRPSAHNGKQRNSPKLRNSQEITDEQIEEIKQYAVNPDSFKRYGSRQSEDGQRRRSMELNDAQAAAAQLSYAPVPTSEVESAGIYGGFR